MKNLSLLFLAALLVPSLGQADVVIPIESVDLYVNIRFSPDAKSEIVGRLRRGEHVPYIRSVPGWHEVGLPGGGSGFIHENWCRVVAKAPDKPADEPMSASPVPFDGPAGNRQHIPSR